VRDALRLGSKSKYGSFYLWVKLRDPSLTRAMHNAFKYRLAKYWSNQDVLFDFNVDLAETGSVPICNVKLVMFNFVMLMLMIVMLCKIRAKRTTCARKNTLDWIPERCRHESL